MTETLKITGQLRKALALGQQVEALRQEEMQHKPIDDRDLAQLERLEQVLQLYEQTMTKLGYIAMEAADEQGLRFDSPSEPLNQDVAADRKLTQ